MTNDEKGLIKKRGSYKGRLTGFINYLDLLTEPLTARDARELQLRVSKLESLYDLYDEVQSQLEILVDNPELQYSERSDFETIYYSSLSKAQDLLCEFDSELANKERSTRTGNNKLVRLPTIELPKFSGSYEQWLGFRDSFMSLIDSNSDIDEINKFHYLRSCLEGSAAVVIQSIEFSASNYTVALKLLCERFDNKRLLIQNHVSALFHIDQITKESSISLKGLLDHLNKNLRALESLGEPVKHWDTLLIFLVTNKLDQKTNREWEEYKGRFDKHRSITFPMFITFLRNRADLIETLEISSKKDIISNTTIKSSTKHRAMMSVRTSFNNNSSCTDSSLKLCPKCNGHHNLSSCPQFLALSNDARLKLLPSYKICYNCFHTGHFANHCKKPGCKVCKRRHNTLIHSDQRPTAVNARDENSASQEVTSLAPSISHHNESSVALSASVTTSRDTQYSDVLLSTALVKMYDVNNCEHVVRAVLDSGSTSSLMTERLCHQLKLPTKLIDRSILGINNVISHVGKTCRVSMKSLNNSFSADLHCFVLPFITNNVPSRPINLSDLKIPSDICLADPTFYKPSEIDILIGADLFWDLLCSQNLKLGNGTPVLYETKLGWIVSGPVMTNHVALLSDSIKCNFIKVNCQNINDNDILQSDLTRFWQLEEVACKPSHYSQEEKLCEDHFVQNTTRLDDGRFCVRIPLKQNPNVLGDSFPRALHCLYSLERRLKLKPEYSAMYHEFMSEYESLGHMSELQHNELDRKAYFIPHHGVLRESSTTTKLRVVYNTSSTTTSGISFNDIQLVGPVVQSDLLSILLRFRQHKYIIAADVEKMYRTVIVHPSDRYLQEILWRDTPDEPVKIYQLNTVTYGTASAPFLATRCLKQIGLDCTDAKIGDVIINDMYVDDLLTGGDDLNEVKNIRREVTNALASAGMSLRKWKSNEPQLVSETTETSLDLNIGSKEPSKLLGLGWHADSDELCFPIGNIVLNGYTKRNLLSVISQIFDPLGLLAPCIIKMKMLMQKLWLDKLSWDEALAPDIVSRWNDIIKSLALLNNLRSPRIVCDAFKTIELHIFSDASESAYGACVYVRSINDQGEVMVRLLMAKSRVSPIKPTTIPRLELCGVLVGVRIYEKVIHSLRLNVNKVYFWTDSTIVLGWLQMLPSRLQPFVRNRVADILDKAGNCKWRHVPTDQNPADLISRGVDFSSIQNLDLWWSGPKYLTYELENWPSHPTRCDTLPELRPEVSLHTIDDVCVNRFIDFSRFSQYLRLIRSIAYVLRFINYCKKLPIKTNFIAKEELENALNLIISTSQDESFPEYKLLLNRKKLPKKSQLVKFNVFLDDNKVMRIGGRLENSNFSYNKKHPILLQSTHEFTKLLFNYEHIHLMHAGPQLLLASIRESYWPIGGRNLAKSCYRKCVRCTRMAGKIVAPLMGNLPRQRTLPGGYVFDTVGVDYAGPIMCASRQGRGCRMVKTYIAIFICFATKAIHLELVGDLTSNSYLLALFRFISRRGKPRDIYSDNGTSFVGAYNDLSNFLKVNNASLSESMANQNINFHFIPAYTPHFGGLWEAGVKSTKHHLRRVLGNCNLTYEQLNTTLTQIEAILNSRPLTPLSSDPADYTPLTPGHFIIGRPLTSLPQPDYNDSSVSHLTRFQRIEQLRQHFWTRWSKEYISELQQRIKWRSCKDNLQLGSLVVIKEDDLPPLKWKLGRVTSVHPGSDGIVRVADITTSTGIIRRSFNRICPLPVSTVSG